jgi:hypothetical protein
MMNLRQALEAGACAAYALATPDLAHFAEITESGTLNPNRKLAKRRYAWLNEHYPERSAAAKHMIGLINSSTAHANIIFTENNFREVDRHRAEAPFFDFEDDFHVKIDLWLIAGAGSALLDFFFSGQCGSPPYRLHSHLHSRFRETRNGKSVTADRHTGEQEVQGNFARDFDRGSLAGGWAKAFAQRDRYRVGIFTSLTALRNALGDIAGSWGLRCRAASRLLLPAVFSLGGFNRRGRDGAGVRVEMSAGGPNQPISFVSALGRERPLTAPQP